MRLPSCPFPPCVGLWQGETRSLGLTLPGLSRPGRKTTPHLCIQVVDPAGFGVRKGIRVGDVGFDIQHRCAIQEVHTAKVQRPSFDLCQFHSRQADRIGTMRGSGGQNAPLRSAPRGLDAAFPPFAAVKGEDEPEPVEAAQVLKDFLVQLILKLQRGTRELPGFRAFHHRALMGCINAAGIRGSQDADGAIDEMGILGHVGRFQVKSAAVIRAVLDVARMLALLWGSDNEKYGKCPINSKAGRAARRPPSRHPCFNFLPRPGGTCSALPRHPATSTMALANVS